MGLALYQYSDNTSAKIAFQICALAYARAIAVGLGTFISGGDTVERGPLLGCGFEEAQPRVTRGRHSKSPP